MASIKVGPGTLRQYIKTEMVEIGMDNNLADIVDEPLIEHAFIGGGTEPVLVSRYLASDQREFAQLPHSLLRDCVTQPSLR